ncbi:MAG: DNA lyase [Dethiosulfovibrio peptidovorans]|nr:MAG: DNA lyase [Dethiosulfovibrio peptidovorans]
MWGQEAHPRVVPFDEPLDGLMLTILSQNTNDNNRDRAFSTLTKAIPSWKDVAALDQETLAGFIRVAGIANVKAGRMLEVLDIIASRMGSYSLKGLGAWSSGEVREFLEGLPGVGPKTAACVLVFDLGIPAFPVDTHVARFCRRMKWVPHNMPPPRIQAYMETVVPESRKKGAHLNIISHGKAICVARSPRCSGCGIRTRCPSAVL